MTNCRLILCEKTAHFAPAVRRELAGNSPRLVRTRIVETRSLPGCEAALAESPESLLAIEVTAANLESVIGFLARLKGHYPRAVAVVLLTAETQEAETLLAEAGAIAVFRSVLDAPALARLAQRKSAITSPTDLSLPEFVADRLPWHAHATHEP
ncbi:MAG TPA: hypothetical protein VGI40_00730 [Pirellulaceae bacterium]